MTNLIACGERLGSLIISKAWCIGVVFFIFSFIVFNTKGRTDKTLFIKFSQTGGNGLHLLMLEILFTLKCATFCAFQRNMPSPHSVSPHHFVRPPLPSTPPLVTTTPLKPHRLQADNSAFRDGMFAHTPGLLEEIKETQRACGWMIAPFSFTI